MMFAVGDPSGEGKLPLISHVSISQGWRKRSCCCCCGTLCWVRDPLDGCSSQDVRSSVAPLSAKLQLGSGRKTSDMQESAGRRSGCWPREAAEIPASLKMPVGASVPPHTSAVPQHPPRMSSETPMGHPAEQGDPSQLSPPTLRGARVGDRLSSAPGMQGTQGCQQHRPEGQEISKDVKNVLPRRRMLKCSWGRGLGGVLGQMWVSVAAALGWEDALHQPALPSAAARRPRPPPAPSACAVAGLSLQRVGGAVAAVAPHL